MKTKLDYYRIFYETARFSSFSTAAQHLYISQSAISQCIRQLETDLNVKLFSRSRRGVTLTKEGSLLFSKVESAMNAIEQGEKNLEKLQHMESGALTIAAGDTITSHFILPYLEKFHALYPGIRIEMANSYSSHMLQLLKDDKADIAFVNLPVQDDELIIKPCLKIHDIFVCGPDHKMKDKYTPEDIAKETLILLEKNSSSRHFLDSVFESRGITLNPQIEIAAYDLLIRFASIHLGVSCVVEEFSKESIEKGIIRKMPLQPALPHRNVGYAYAKDKPLSIAAQSFLLLITKKEM